MVPSASSINSRSPIENSSFPILISTVITQPRILYTPYSTDDYNRTLSRELGTASQPAAVRSGSPSPVGVAVKKSQRMQFKELFTDDRAVSPVIGVILMVAITVILAAVIGTFVLGLGDQVQQTTPQASFSFDGLDDAGTDVTVTHEGGDAINADRLSINAGGSEAVAAPAFESNGSDVTAGSSQTVSNGNISSDDTIRVIWTSDDGSNSAILGRGEVA